MRTWNKARGAALLVLGMALGVSAWAAGPSVSIPSTPDVSGKVVVKGADLPAYSSVTVRFVHEKMSPIDSVAQVAANGSFAVKFDPPITGSYTVLVFDGKGQQIGKGNFGYFR